MKKNIVLVMVVLALLVVPAFAEPTFSGEAKYTLVVNNDVADGTDIQWEDMSNNAKINFDAQMDDFTSLSAEVKADQGKALEVQTMVFSQDLTGALGIDGPVSFSYKLGKQDYAPKNYSLTKEPDAKVGVLVEKVTEEVWTTKAVKDDNDVIIGYTTVKEDVDVKNGNLIKGSDSSMLGFVATIGIMDALNIDVAVYPTVFLNEAEKDEELAINVYGAFGNVEASVYYTKSVLYNYCKDTDDDGMKDDKGDMFGFNAKATFDALAVSALVETRLEDEGVDKKVEKATSKAAVAATYDFGDLDLKLGVDVAGIGNDKHSVNDTKEVDWNVKDAADVDLNVDYVMDALTAGLAVEGSLDDFAGNSNAKLTVKYALGNATFFAAGKATQFKDFKAEDHFKYDLGVSSSIGAATYAVGYNNGIDTLDTLADEGDKGFFFQVKASF